MKSVCNAFVPGHKRTVFVLGLRLEEEEEEHHIDSLRRIWRY